MSARARVRAKSVCPQSVESLDAGDGNAPLSRAERRGAPGGITLFAVRIRRDGELTGTWDGAEGAAKESLGILAGREASSVECVLVIEEEVEGERVSMSSSTLRARFKVLRSTNDTAGRMEASER